MTATAQDKKQVSENAAEWSFYIAINHKLGILIGGRKKSATLAVRFGSSSGPKDTIINFEESLGQRLRLALKRDAELTDEQVSGVMDKLLFIVTREAAAGAELFALAREKDTLRTRY